METQWYFNLHSSCYDQICTFFMFHFHFILEELSFDHYLFQLFLFLLKRSSLYIRPDWLFVSDMSCKRYFSVDCLLALLMLIPDVQAGFRKGRGTRDQIANIHWIIKKAREFQKNIDSCFIDYAKPFDYVDHNKQW